MPLGVFVIIDNKGKTCLVCQVLVSNESLDTHIWILECIRKATEQAPIVMFTDADPALDAAIPIVFPETYPAHCIFHIAQNLPKNLKAKLGGKWDDFSIIAVIVYVNHYLNKDGTNYLTIIQWPKTIFYVH